MTDAIAGSWDGLFSYPACFGPPTPFVASLTETGGHVTGTVIEPRVFGAAGTIEASLSGHRSGQSVDFTKTYRHPPPGYENPVDYVGRLSEDGSRIEGVWSVLDLDGTFEMTRDIAAEPERASQRTTERIG